MVRPSILAALAALAACVHAPSEQPREVVIAPSPAPAPVLATEPPPEPASPPPPCPFQVEPPSLPPAVVPATRGACRHAPAAITKQLTAEIKHDWLREWPTGRLEIRPGCDRLAPELASMVLEQSSGHGGSLTLMSLTRRSDGDHDLVLLEYNHYFTTLKRDRTDPWQADSAGQLAVSHARIPRATAAPLLARLRAAAHVEIQEHEPPPTSPSSSVGYGSSNDYHVALRLTDGKGHGVQRAFIGYAGSGPEQADGVPLAIVARAVDVFLADEKLRATFTPAGADDLAARDLFARVFWAVQARQEGDAAWYLRERLLGMAALLGDVQHLPALLTEMRTPAGKPGVERSRVLAINAFTAITGYDRRHDPKGAPRPPQVVADELVTACVAHPPLEIR